MYADGTPYKGGRSHTPHTPKDHDIINPPPLPSDGSYVEPTAFLPGGQPIVLGRGRSSGAVTPRSVSPSVSTAHGSGKRHITPNGSFRDSPSRQSPVVLHHKPSLYAPRDHIIVGVCERPDALDSARQTPRGPRHLDGCPAFDAPSFDKKPYLPQTKRVASKIPDNDIFNTKPAAETSPASAHCTPRRGQSPSRLFQTAPVTPSSGVRRGYVAPTMAARSPAPYAQVSESQTPTRSRTPSRASPGSSSYNIITGVPLPACR